MTYILPILAVLLSFGVVYITKPKNKSHFKLLLAFSGAFLLALTVFEMLPAVYAMADPKTVGVFVMLGILLQIFLEFFSKGAEHGHVHVDHEKSGFPWAIFLSLCTHSFLEGFPIEHHHTILYGVLIHKVPIAIILSIFFLSSKISLGKALIFIGIFSLMTPLGTYLAASTDWVEEFYAPINSLVIGVFFHISTVILFESSDGHSFNLRKIIVIALGILFAYFI